MSRRTRRLSGLLVFILISGCRSNELSRSNAKSVMIKMLSQAPDTQMTLSVDQAKKLLDLNKEDANKTMELMDLDKLKGCVPDPSDARVMTGQMVVCTRDAPPEVTWQKPGMLVPLRKPIYSTISEISGISDDPKGPTDKLVEFTWHHDLTGLPKSLVNILTPTTPYKGTAVFRHYDDGWRLVEYR